jgi:tRNA 2-thiouridine synthesizing protein D
MATLKTLTFLLMDAPFESDRTSTAFRLLAAALDKGHNVNVFAYEGAVALSFAKQARHANAVHGRTEIEEAHPLSRDWIKALQLRAASTGLEFVWMNCGLCVDERGVGEVIQGVRRGGPADFWAMAEKSDNTLVIATR